MLAHTVLSESWPLVGLLDTHVGSFVAHLRAAGYADETFRKKRSVARSFARWTRRERIAVDALNESHVAAFLKRCQRRRSGWAALMSVTVRHFLGHLRMEGEVPPPVATEVSPADALLQDYVDYLRSERGLAENSICVYVPYVRDFLSDRVARCGCVAPERFDAAMVHAFVIEHVRSRSSGYAKLLGSALRSFLRFLYAHGRTMVDLSFAIPTVRRWDQAAAPDILSPEEVERTLSATDRATPTGRRDYAILLLLARLGLRANEVARLELDDIVWRTGELIIHGKGGALDRMPLLSDIGDALALYLRKDRGHSSSRRVFLRMIAPRMELSGTSPISAIACGALSRAGIQRNRRGAAHLFRHSLATRMIRHGASISEIAEVLRHRSQGTTERYAKVDFETLRGVARPWPGKGGAR